MLVTKLTSCIVLTIVGHDEESVGEGMSSEGEAGEMARSFGGEALEKD